MRREIKSIAIAFLVCLAFFLAGCASSTGMGLPLAANMPGLEGKTNQDPTATLVIYQPPVDSTATPTPFQPIPPTAVYLPTDTPMPTASPLPTSTPAPTATPGPITRRSNKRVGSLGALQPENQMNILLLGSDRRPGGSLFRTDTIILATLNMDLGTVNFTSFPRDLYVNIPGWGTDRINVAWQHGGFDKLAETMNSNFGIRPDHYVLVNFSSFKQIVDSLGGLDVEVNNKLSDYRNGRWVNVPKGLQHMDADTALWYARSRKTTSDFYRGKRQQEILQALFNKILSMNGVQRIPELYELYKNNVMTDMEWPEIFSWAPLAAKMTDSSHLKHYYVGPDSAYDWITYEGAMVLIPIPEKIQKTLRQALNIP